MLIKKITIFSIFLFLVICFLSTKYIEIGECAIMVYYIPMLLRDYIAIIVVGLLSISLSNFVSLNNINYKWFFIETFIYILFVAFFCICGNKLLELPEYSWPYNYHPAPYID